MKILSIHDGHNSSVAYMEDGEVKFAIQEERLNKIKNSGGFPSLSVEEVLSKFKLNIEQIDRFVFVGTEAPFEGVNVRDKVLEKYGTFFRGNKKSNFLKVYTYVKKILKRILKYEKKSSYVENNNFRLRNLINKGVDVKKVTFLDHHLCHASSAAYGWGKNEPFVVITSDSAGDGLSGTVSVFEDGILKRKAVIKAEDSIARIYSLITYYMGMVPMEHEYKIMGLAPYSEDSKKANEIVDYFFNLFKFNDDGITYSRKEGVEPVYEFGLRIKEYLLFKRFDIISSGLQLFTEKLVTEWVKRILIKLNIKKVAFSGGLFMNVKLNKKISELNEVEEVFVFPSCGDESNVFGALYYEYFNITGLKPKNLSSLYLGGDFNDKDIEKSLLKYSCNKFHYKKIDDIEKKIAELLSKNEIVARFKGRMEFGARALGNRSILANASDFSSVKIINKMIKSRDFWMPFAPSMIDSGRYILNDKKIPSPYMIMSFNILKNKNDVLSSVIHPYDETCRPQEVYEEWNKDYYRLIKYLSLLNGESVVLNTSFNLHGFPVVYSPEDALYVFINSGLKYLAIGSYLLEKK
jgi:carbamoyltransferase